MADVVILPQSELVTLAAEYIGSLVHEKPELVLGVATGSTPLQLYQQLARSGADFSRASAFALDEYVGLPESHPESYTRVIDTQVTRQLGFQPERVHVPSGNHATLATAGPEFEAKIRAAGGIDVQILGIGTNGHVGFNEPGSSFASRTRVQVLAEQTRIDNSRFFDSLESVPRHCVTQGIGTILEARHLLLLAFGKQKAAAVRAALEGPVSSLVPASAIQLHPRVSVLLDEDAASELAMAEYYRYAWQNKFGGQVLG